MTFEINCEMCKTFVKQFFNGSLGYTMRDYIYCHLLECKDCYNKFKTYASEIEKDFNLKEDAIEFVLDNKDKLTCRTKDKLIKMGFQSDIEARVNRWTMIAEKFNIEKLSNLTAFADFLEEDFNINVETYDDDIYAINKYSKYFAIKLCKMIDHLELCYSLNKKEENTDGEKS